MRQVLEQEFQLFCTRRGAAARQARFAVGGSTKFDKHDDGDKENLPAQAGDGGKRKPKAAKRDFFGRIVANEETVREASSANNKAVGPKGGDANRIWVSYHEGFSNAVRKPITLAELMSGL